jgi:hypothetical protein
LPDPGWEPPLGAPREIKPHCAVYSPDPLVIPKLPSLAHPVETFPEAPTAMFGNDFVEFADDDSVFGCSVPFRTIPD